MNQPVRMTLVLAALMTGAGCARTTATPAESPATSPRDDAESPDSVPFGSRCRARTSGSKDGMMVACEDKQIMFVLPGVGWKVGEETAPPMIVSANSGPLNVSVRLADPGETQYELREHLSAIHGGIRQGLASQGVNVGEPHLEAAPNGHLVLWYELTTTASPNMPAVRMANAWTALRRSDRRYVDYHVSVTLAPDDAAWHGSPESSPSRRMVALADAFFVAGDRAKSKSEADASAPPVVRGCRHKVPGTGAHQYDCEGFSVTVADDAPSEPIDETKAIKGMASGLEEGAAPLKEKLRARIVVRLSDSTISGRKVKGAKVLAVDSKDENRLYAAFYAVVVGRRGIVCSASSSKGTDACATVLEQFVAQAP